MSLALIFQKLKGYTIKTLRFLFEDREMRGDRFDGLKCSKSGAIWVDIADVQASESYKKAREQSDRVLGIKPNINMENETIPEIRIDSFGRIILPSSIRKKIAEETHIEFREFDDGKIVILLSPRLGNTRRRRYKLEDLLKEAPSDPVSNKLDNR
jgi:bifunctional DNA-binding transcriptional regulator/antitoxin component of YhaV-PrlF toxin-antitoxin module